MGQQQLLLIVLVILIVGIAIIVGLGYFDSAAKNAHEDQMRNDMLTFVANATAYKNRPGVLGGGSGSFWGYSPAGGTADDRSMSSSNQGIIFETEVARYHVEYWPAGSAIAIKIIASSKSYGAKHPSPSNSGNVTLTACFNQNGMLSQRNFAGCEAGRFLRSGPW